MATVICFFVSTRGALDTKEWSQPKELLTRGNGHEAQFEGEYVARHTFCPFIRANMAKEVQALAGGNDSGMCKADFASDALWVIFPSIVGGYNRW